MDLAFAKARETGPDLIIANDPDADRCAGGRQGRADWPHAARRRGRRAARPAPGEPRRARHLRAVLHRLLLLLGRIAEKAGLPYEETLTGFKWIARVEGAARYGYEEALGYCVDPDGVRRTASPRPCSSRNSPPS